MITFLIIIIILLSTLCYNIGYNKGFADNQPIAKDSTPIVYITPSGQRYHKKNCDYISKTRAIEISKKQAEEKRHKPCGNCLD